MRLLATVNGRLIDSHQLTLFDVLLLDFLANSGNSAVRKSELAAALMLAPSRVAQQIGRLQARGLVSRGPTRFDRRGVLVTITRDGRALADVAIKTYAQEIRTHYLGHMSPEQMIALSDSCCQIGTPLKTAKRPAKFRRM
ncbi:MAG: MarR family winged helix-turn-helix transcriptional regulator [Mycobacterium sp.]